MLVKSEFVVGGLRSQTIFSGIYLPQHVSNLSISSLSSVIIGNWLNWKSIKYKIREKGKTRDGK